MLWRIWCRSLWSEAGRRSSLSLGLLAEQVGAPVDNIEEGEDEREGDSGDDVDPFAPRREFAEPGPTAVVAGLFGLRVNGTMPKHHRCSRVMMIGKGRG